jgi:hypothetical protein
VCFEVAWELTPPARTPTDDARVANSSPRQKAGRRTLGWLTGEMAGVPPVIKRVLTGKIPVHPRAATAGISRQTWNELPHPQLFTTLGLLNTNPRFSRPS